MANFPSGNQNPWPSSVEGDVLLQGVNNIETLLAGHDTQLGVDATNIATLQTEVAANTASIASLAGGGGVVTTPPNPPTGTPVATAGVTSATVAFTPATTGGTAASFTVTSSPGGITATGTSSPIVVMGLTAGTTYTFRVTATNAGGTSAASASSNGVTPTAALTAPFAPTIGVATAGANSASVSFTPNGAGAPATSYTVTSSGGQTGTGTGSPIAVGSLSNGTAYTFTVTATNAAGTSSPSAASNSVTPTSSGTWSQDFETTLAGAGAAANNANTTAAVSTTQAHTGTQSLKLTATASGATSAYYNGALVPPGVPFTSTIWCYSTTAGLVASLELDCKTSTSGFLQAFNGSNVTVPANTWTQLTVTGTSPATTGETTGLVFFTATGAGQIMYFDTATISYTAPSPPDPPTMGHATAGAASASVTFTPAGTGGTPTSYSVTSTPGSISATGSASPITVTGLTNGTAYSFKVTATNSAGTSAASAASNTVTPSGSVSGGYGGTQPVGVPGGHTYTLVTDVTFGSTTLPADLWPNRYGRVDALEWDYNPSQEASMVASRCCITPGDGLLHLTIDNATSGEIANGGSQYGTQFQYVTGMVSGQSGDLTFGNNCYLEASIWFKNSGGCWPAWWSLSTVGWPPEIDGAEFGDIGSSGVPTFNYHYLNGSQNQENYSASTDLRGGYHTYGTLIYGGYVSEYIDGVLAAPAEALDGGFSGSYANTWYPIFGIGVNLGGTPVIGDAILSAGIRKWTVA